MRNFRLVKTDRAHPRTLGMVIEQRKAYKKIVDLCPKKYFKSGERSTLDLFPEFKELATKRFLSIWTLFYLSSLPYLLIPLSWVREFNFSFFKLGRTEKQFSA